MSHYLITNRAVITERRAPDGWIAYVANAPAVCGYGDTEQAALDALRALFTEARDVAPQDVEHSPAPWQV